MRRGRNPSSPRSRSGSRRERLGHAGSRRAAAYGRRGRAQIRPEAGLPWAQRATAKWALGRRRAATGEVESSWPAAAGQLGGAKWRLRGWPAPEFEAEEVGGGWLMIGGADFEEEEGEGQKWKGGLLYIAGGARVGGFCPSRSRSISIGRPGAEGVR